MNDHNLNRLEGSSDELRIFLNEKASAFEHPKFAVDDPVEFPRRYAERAWDAEVAGLFAAVWAWGQRKSIRASLEKLFSSMDDAPGDFVLQASDLELAQWKPGHRTFLPEDGRVFVRGLRRLHQEHGSLAPLFQPTETEINYFNALDRFRLAFLEAAEAPARTAKHVASPAAGSAAKRLHLYLRWMVRPAAGGVDLGIWSHLPKSKLSCPLDVHSGRVARSLGLLQRTATDARAVLELDAALRKLDPQDPVKYDYALFGMGVEGLL